MTEPSTNTANNSAHMIRDKILKVLEIYPRISPSMLQIGIGSSLPTHVWHPVLADLLTEGVVAQDDLVSLSSSGRNQVYKILHIVNAVAA